MYLPASPQAGDSTALHWCLSTLARFIRCIVVVKMVGGLCTGQSAVVKIKAEPVGFMCSVFFVVVSLLLLVTSLPE